MNSRDLRVLRHVVVLLVLLLWLVVYSPSHHHAHPHHNPQRSCRHDHDAHDSARVHYTQCGDTCPAGPRGGELESVRRVLAADTSVARRGPAISARAVACYTFALLGPSARGCRRAAYNGRVIHVGTHTCDAARRVLVIIALGTPVYRTAIRIEDYTDVVTRVGRVVVHTRSASDAAAFVQTIGVCVEVGVRAPDSSRTRRTLGRRCPAAGGTGGATLKTEHFLRVLYVPRVAVYRCLYCISTINAGPGAALLSEGWAGRQAFRVVYEVEPRVALGTLEGCAADRADGAVVCTFPALGRCCIVRVSVRARTVAEVPRVILEVALGTRGQTVRSSRRAVVVKDRVIA